MNLDNLNKWLTLLANFGVMAGVIFLAIEVRQNQISLDRGNALMEQAYTLTVAEGQKELADSADDLRFLRIQDPDITRIWLDGRAGKELSPIDQSRYDDMCESRIWGSAINYRRNIALGHLDLLEHEQLNFRDEIRTLPGMRACWERKVPMLRRWGYEHLVDGVQEKLNK